MNIESIVEALGRGLMQGILGARPAKSSAQAKGKPRSLKSRPEPIQEEMFPMPTFGREAVEISPEQLAQRMTEFEEQIGNERPVRKPSPPPKGFPGDENYPKVSSDTYQPSREDDTEGQATGIPWRS